MKKILLILIACAFFAHTQGQMVIRAQNNARAIASSGFTARSAEYDTVYQAMTTKPTAAYAVIDDDMVYSLDSAGFWDRMDYLLIVASENEDGALINWIKPGTYDADNVSSTAWTQFEGYTGDASADYISTNFNVSSNTVNYTLDNSSVGIYIRDNQQEAQYIFIATDGTNATGLVPRNASDQKTARVNSDLLMAGSAVLDCRGTYIVSRTADDACAVYLNGTSIDSETDTSSSIPDAEMLILSTPTPTYSDHQFSIFWIMDGVADATEAAKINTIFERRMDRLGKGVQ